MKKRAIRYLSGTFFVSTVPTLVGTQQVSAEGGNPIIPRQQRKVVDIFMKRQRNAGRYMSTNLYAL